MNLIKKVIFSTPNLKPNTFIGGISHLINTPQLLASDLGVNVVNVKGFRIKGADIEAFVKQAPLIGIESLITRNAYSFKGIGEYYNVLNMDLFRGRVSVLDFPDAVVNNLRLTYESQVVQMLLPNLKTDANGNIFATLTQCELIDIRRYVFPPNSMNSSWSFSSLKLRCKIKVDIANKTSNNGGVAATLITAKNTRQAIVEFYENGIYHSTL